MKIITLGPERTFSHEAALKYEPEAECTFKNTVWEVFKELKSNNADYGVIPIENSVSGSIGQTFDALLEFDIPIVSEVTIEVRHFLASLGKTKDIKYLYTHPLTYVQCEKYIRRTLKIEEIMLTDSNARSAQKLTKTPEKEYGAIVSHGAIKKYKLSVIAKDIQDSKYNITRFVVVGSEKTSPTGKDRTSIAIYPQTDHPGLLYTMIGELAKRKINMTKIESKPSKGKIGDYIFFIEMEGHKDNPEMEEALSAIGKMFYVKVLGSYPRSY
ncbi:prephenate dehydratase [Candidatus Woesearchaeota archaeon]|nr:prephenate dehydratase [Candidatus Woesearchaeota archaeon]